MSNAWTAEITNDPDSGFELYIELLEGEEYRGRILRDPSSGEIMLMMYQSKTSATIPLRWLLSVVADAERDLPRRAGEAK